MTDCINKRRERHCRGVLFSHVVNRIMSFDQLKFQIEVYDVDKEASTEILETLCQEDGITFDEKTYDNDYSDLAQIQVDTDDMEEKTFFHTFYASDPDGHDEHLKIHHLIGPELRQSHSLPKISAEMTGLNKIKQQIEAIGDFETDFRIFTETDGQ